MNLISKFLVTMFIVPMSLHSENPNQHQYARFLIL
jgi:hypothetical protein